MNMPLSPRVFLYSGLVIFALTVVYIGPIDIYDRVVDANIENVIASIFVYFLILLLGLLRWIIYLKMLYVHISPMRLSRVYFTNCFFSNLTPARAGDILAPSQISHRCGVSLPKSITMIFTDRLGDLLVLVVCFILSCWWLLHKYSALNLFDIFSPLQIFIYIILLSIFIYLLIRFFLRRWLVNLSDFQYFIGDVLSGFSYYKSKRKMSVIVVLSFSNWLLHFLKEFFLLNAFVEISYLQVAVCLSITNILALVSFVPSGIGVNVVSNAAIATAMGLDWEGVAASTLFGTVLFNSVRMAFGFLFNMSDDYIFPNK